MYARASLFPFRVFTEAISRYGYICTALRLTDRFADRFIDRPIRETERRKDGKTDAAMGGRKEGAFEAIKIRMNLFESSPPPLDSVPGSQLARSDAAVITERRRVTRQPGMHIRKTPPRPRVLRFIRSRRNFARVTTTQIAVYSERQLATATRGPNAPRKNLQLSTRRPSERTRRVLRARTDSSERAF